MNTKIIMIIIYMITVTKMNSQTQMLPFSYTIRDTTVGKILNKIKKEKKIEILGKNNSPYYIDIILYNEKNEVFFKGTINPNINFGRITPLLDIYPYCGPIYFEITKKTIKKNVVCKGEFLILIY